MAQRCAASSFDEARLQLIAEKLVGSYAGRAFDQGKTGMSAGAASGKLPAFDAGHFVFRGVCRIVRDFVNSGP